MLKILVNFEDDIDNPDEYTMGYMVFEKDGNKVDSEEMSGRGLMMVFLSVTSLLEAINILASGAKAYKFVGEDSSFVINLRKSGKNNIQICKDKKELFLIPFTEFILAVWELSDSLFKEFGPQIDVSNIAKKAWLYELNKAKILVDQVKAS